MEDNEEQLKLLPLKLEAAQPACGGVDGGGATFILFFSIFISVCGSFVSGCALGYTSPVQSGIMADLGLSTADYSLFGSMLTVGGLLGSLVCGKITDYIGRRLTMGLADTIYLTGWLAIAFSQGTWSLDLGRLALAFATGLVVYAVPVYIAEITPKNLRGGAVLLHQLMTSCGIALAYVAGLVTTWRTLALIGTVPCLIQLCGLFFIPESPRWLVKIEDEGYEAALRSLRGENANISHEAAEIKVSLGLMALGAFGGILFFATTIIESASNNA